MSDQPTPHAHETTLDPPGRIAVIGAGVLGVEAALYGRFLGYDVTLIEAEAVGGCLRDRGDEPVPVLPDRCISPLALGALQAQAGADADPTLPTTFAQWHQNIVVPLTESDLLRGRVRVPLRVTSIEPLDLQSEADEDEESDEPIPHDFRLIVHSADEQPSPIDAEAVIVATGPELDVKLGFTPPVDYYFRIGESSSGDWEVDLRAGLRQIVTVYATLAGRADLDLYRPRRG